MSTTTASPGLEDCPATSTPLVLILAGVIITLSIGFGAASYLSPQAKAARASQAQAQKAATEQTQARSMAELMVAKKLKSPATAKFSPGSETTVAPLEDGSFHVRGWVDSQNSFGALIRNRFTVRVWPEAGGLWQGDEFALSEW